MESGYMSRYIRVVDKRESDYFDLVICYADGGEEHVAPSFTMPDAKALAEATAFQMAKDGHEGFTVEIRS